MAGRTTDDRRTRQTVARLKRFDEILRFAALDPDIPDLPEVHPDDLKAAGAPERELNRAHDHLRVIELLRLGAIASADERNRSERPRASGE